MKIIHAAVVATMVAGLAVGARAQSASMPKDTMAKGDSMGMAKSAPTSYTGCVEAGSTAGSYILTHFTAGTAMVWVIDPKKKAAAVYTSPTKFKPLDETGVLEGGRVLPGFRLPLSDLFAAVKRKKK